VRTIWKTTLDLLQEIQLVRFPRGARLLTVQTQHGYMPVLWAEVQEDAPLEARAIAIYGTGWPLPADPGVYIGTVQDEIGGLVWHIYERPLEGEAGVVLSSGGKTPKPGVRAKPHEEAAVWTA